MTAQQQFDQERSEAFADRLVDILNSGALALMTSIGYRTGLFDAMADLPPQSRSPLLPTSASATSANGWALW